MTRKHGTAALDALCTALREDCLTVRQSATLLGVSSATARRHLKTLVEAGRAFETTVVRGGNRGGTHFSLFSWSGGSSKEDYLAAVP